MSVNDFEMSTRQQGLVNIQIIIQIMFEVLYAWRTIFIEYDAYDVIDCLR